MLPYDRGPEPPKLIKELPSLRVVQSLSAGVETLVPLLPEGVRLANGRGLHDLSVAEHALALIHAAQRDLPRWFAQQARGEWTREHTRSLADSRVLLVGHGSIGQAIERQLLAAEAVVTRVASRARPDEDVTASTSCRTCCPRPTSWCWSSRTPPRRAACSTRRPAALPDDALVVNVGRGTAIDTDALLAETRTGRLRAGLDVVDPEPLPAAIHCGRFRAWSSPRTSPAARRGSTRGRRSWRGSSCGGTRRMRSCSIS